MRIVIISMLLLSYIVIHAQEETTTSGKHEIGLNYTFFGRNESHGLAIEHRYRFTSFQLKTTLGIRSFSASYLTAFQNFPSANQASYTNRNSVYSEEKLYFNIGIEKDVELSSYSSFFLGADVASHFGRVHQRHTYTLYNFDEELEKWTIGASNINNYQQSIQTINIGLIINAGLKLSITEQLQLITYAAPALFIHDIAVQTIDEIGTAQYYENMSMSKRGYATFSTFYGVTFNYQLK
jgi:hypothetical protein